MQNKIVLVLLLGLLACSEAEAEPALQKVIDIPAAVEGGTDSCPGVLVPKTVCVQCSNGNCGGVCWTYTGIPYPSCMARIGIYAHFTVQVLMTNASGNVSEGAGLLERSSK
jgi:hypothetical protein